MYLFEITRSSAAQAGLEHVASLLLLLWVLRQYYTPSYGPTVWKANLPVPSEGGKSPHAQLILSRPAGMTGYLQWSLTSPFSYLNTCFYKDI